MSISRRRGPRVQAAHRSSYQHALTKYPEMKEIAKLLEAECGSERSQASCRMLPFSVSCPFILGAWGTRSQHLQASERVREKKQLACFTKLVRVSDGSAFHITSTSLSSPGSSTERYAIPHRGRWLWRLRACSAHTWRLPLGCFAPGHARRHVGEQGIHPGTPRIGVEGNRRLLELQKFTRHGI